MPETPAYRYFMVSIILQKRHSDNRGLLHQSIKYVPSVFYTKNSVLAMPFSQFTVFLQIDPAGHCSRAAANREYAYRKFIRGTFCAARTVYSPTVSSPTCSRQVPTT